MNSIIEGIAAQAENRNRPYCAYLYDLRQLKAHAARLTSVLPGFCELFYAVKANSEAPILRTLSPIVSGFEVASLGEIEKVRSVSADTPILFGGPGKTDGDIGGALAHGVRLFHIESEHELLRIALLAEQRRIAVSVMLRVNLAGPLPEATLSMAGTSTQFGIEEQRIPEVIRLALSLPSIRLEGFHLHSISNNLSYERHLDLIAYYCGQVKQWSEAFGLRLSFLNAGGGIGVNYQDIERQFDWDRFTSALEERIAPLMLPGVRLIFECGRYVSAFCGSYVAEVIDIKKNHGKLFAVIRGGTHHFRLPASWQHSHPFRVIPVERWDYPFPRKEVSDCEVTVAGELCTPKDVLATDAFVSRLRIGDLLAFQYAGAYGWSISHHDFLSHPHPEHIYID